MVLLETVRTRLRRFQITDLPHLLELESDAEILKFITNGVIHSPEAIRLRLEKLIAEGSKQEPLGVWGAWHKESNDFIGWFMLRYYERFPEPELGFMLVKRHWREGYTYEISCRLIELAKELKIAMIVAITHADNVASIRVLEKSGFCFDKIVDVASGPANLYRLNLA